jgi:AAA domain
MVRLWRGHLLIGSLELLTGLPGMAKSQIHCQYVACVTTGRAWPDGTNGIRARNVIMLTAEDCLDQIIVPRLVAAKADLSRVHILKKVRKDQKDRMFLLTEDVETLAKVIAEVGEVGLVTIDPITAYMGGKVDSHRATDVRSQLGPLAELAERTDVAFSAITHPAKNASQRAIDHYIGSQAFIAAARIGHLCVDEMDENDNGRREPTGRMLFANPKNNPHQKMPTLAYRITQAVGGVDPRTGSDIVTPVVACVERSLYERANGYNYPAVKIFMPAGSKQPVVVHYEEHCPPDVGAAFIWLKNRDPDHWRDVQNVEHVLGKYIISDKPMSEEEWAPSERQ